MFECHLYAGLSLQGCWNSFVELSSGASEIRQNFNSCVFRGYKLIAIITITIYRYIYIYIFV